MLPRSAMALADLILPVLQAVIKRSHFAGGDLTPPLTKGDARPLLKPISWFHTEVGVVNYKFIGPAFLTVQDE